MMSDPNGTVIRMSRTAPVACPRCHSNDTIRIAYGMPGPELMEAAGRGEVVLGGCCIAANQPNHKCSACGEAFADDRGSSTSAKTGRGRGPVNWANGRVGAAGLEPPTSAL